MRKNKIVKINGTDFELCKWADNPPTWARVQNVNPRYNELSEAYGHYSTRKANAWRKWKEWAIGMPCRIWIESRNCNFFSIAGFCEWENVRYWVYITYAHNRAWKVEK